MGSVRRIVLWTSITAVVAYACEWGAMKFTLPDSIVAVVWPASGFAVSIGVLVSPWVAIGAGLADIAYQWPVMGSFRPAALSGLALGIQVGVISVFVRRVLGGRGALATPGAVVRYTLGAAMLGTTISATLGLATLYLEGFIPADAFVVSWLTWWASDVVAILLIVPFILAWSRRTDAPQPPARETLALVAATGALVALVLAAPLASGTFALAILSLPLVAWSAFRFGTRAVTSVSLALGIAAFAQLIVPWRSATADLAALLEAQLFISLASATGLVVAASVERERARLHAAAIKEFEAVNDARARLLQTFAHELNNPLTPMLLQLELIREGEAGKLSDDALERLALIERSTVRLSKLVRDLRDIGQLSSGSTLKLDGAPADLAAIARDVVETYRPAARSGRMVIRIDAPPAAILEGDADRLAQVVSNLLDNAVKYSPPEGEVLVEVRSEPERVRVRVSDRGPGLTAEQMTRLFLPFTQVQPGDRQKRGSGLGLHIARAIVEGHGGALVCASDGVDRGASFEMILPTRADPSTGPKASPDANVGAVPA